MWKTTSWKMIAGRVLGLCAGIFMLTTAGIATAGQVPSGTVTIDQVRVAFLISGQMGGGTLNYKGKSYGFKIGGLGVGGIGVASIEATGEVYNLNKVSDFAGAFLQARAGIVIVDKGMEGGLWLKNTNGVVMNLNPKRTGLALTLGADAILVELK